MDSEEDVGFDMTYEGRDTRNLKHNGDDGKRRNKKEVARRYEVMEKRKNQCAVE